MVIKMLKIAIIHVEISLDGKNMNGQIIFLSTDDVKEEHIVTLVYFLKTHYLDDPNLQKLTYLYPIQTASYVFTRLGDIMFLDTTGANPRSNDSSGTFMMPDHITDAQKEALHQFKQYIINYTDVRIDYQISYQDGIFDSLTLRGHGENAANVIDNYLRKIDEKDIIVK